MTLISKSAGALGLSTCIIDMHNTGLIASERKRAKAGVNSFLSNEINSMKTDTCSFKDAQIKNWTAKHNLMQPVKEFFASVTGYIGGFFTAGIRYIPNIALAAIALCCNKSKGIANAAAAALGILVGVNIVKNVTGIGEKNDYLNL